MLRNFVYKYLMKEIKDKVGLFLEVSSVCTGGDEPQLKYKKFFLNVRKKLFYCESGQILAQVDQRDYLDHLNYQKKSAGHSPEQPTFTYCALTREMNSLISRGDFPFP